MAQTTKWLPAILDYMKNAKFPNSDSLFVGKFLYDTGFPRPVHKSGSDLCDIMIRKDILSIKTLHSLHTSAFFIVSH